MTPQEAIDIIKVAIAEVEWNYPMDYAVAFEGAIEALEKQIPQKPVDTDWLYCPNCKKSLNVMAKEKFCNDCGQALDWSDI